MTNPPAAARWVLYSGRVQGVGFRATAASVARRHSVTGWVRNLPDGRVELWAEGADGEVERFLAAIRDRWGTAITDEEATSHPAVGSHTGFVVAS